ncbi:MAG: transposase [Chloroflexi bacterium]|nr:transposase [Chloroflexota bacterium]
MNQPTQEKTKVPFSVPLSQTNGTKGSGDSGSRQEFLLEPVDLESYNLSYTCLLIPRLPSHQLEGSLANLLPQWLQQVCLSYGWTLEFSNVQTDYLQWAIMVTPSTPPGHFMRQIRYEISRMIFDNFKHIQTDSLSDDFWAPGYLVVLGTRPHPEEMIRQYIRLARRQQGLNTP